MRPALIALFQEVADRSPDERAEYYAAHQVGDAVRDEIESLLRYDDSSDSLRAYVESAERRLLDSASSRSSASAERRSPSLPESIGRFAVARLLGRGGMGEVYLARDPVLDRPVAIKLIGSGLEDETARRRLVREARTAGRLRHPNIVTVFEAGEHESRGYIAMEYVPGETLGSLIRRRAAVPLRRRLEMIEGACAGLAHAHRAGVIHLDIKPDNLMLDDAGVVKVLDFGIARRVHAETLATGQVAGTLRYMSPEQIQGVALDHRSDVFSLGCALFELVTYSPAFHGSTQEIVTRIAQGPVPSLLDRSPQIDPALETICRKAMSLDAAGRYDDLDQFRADLMRVRSSIDPAEDEPQRTVPLGVATGAPDSGWPAGKASSRLSRERSSWRSRGIAAAAVSLLVTAGSAAYVSWGSGTAPAAAERAPAPVAPPPAPVALADPVPASSAAGVPADDVWRQLARGDRAGVLAQLGAASRRGADPVLERAVVDTVRTTVLAARESAAGMNSGAAADVYRAGEEQLARANRLAASGLAVESLRAFWQASDLYSRTASTPPAPAADLESRTLPADAAVDVQRQVLEPPRETAVMPQPPPIVQPSAPAAAVPATAAAAISPAPPPVRNESQAVLEALGRYDAAYESLDVTALLRVFPSLGQDQIDQLRRTFAGMTSYEVDTSNVRVDVNEESAIVNATVARRMAPRVGSPVSTQTDTEFRLRRQGADWIIVGVSAR